MSDLARVRMELRETAKGSKVYIVHDGVSVDVSAYVKGVSITTHIDDSPVTTAEITVLPENVAMVAELANVRFKEVSPTRVGQVEDVTTMGHSVRYYRFADDDADGAEA